jgi:hypothetical protein
MTETTPTPVDYWVGDLCYVMHDVWDEICNSVPFDNSEHEFELGDGRKFILFNTAYGDGEYTDQNGNRYGVDAGVIGAIKVEDIHDQMPYLEGGTIHTFPAEINEMDCFYEDGTIHIYTVRIETGDSDYDD